MAEEKELSQEEIEAISANAAAKIAIVEEWEQSHQEEAIALINNAAGVLARYATVFEENFPLLAVCPSNLVVGALQAAYLYGYINGAEILKLDNLTK